MKESEFMKMYTIKQKFFCTCTMLLLWAVFGLSSQSLQGYPELSSLDSNDALFQQISADIQEFYRWQARNGNLPALTIYQYRVKQNDNLFSLAARLNLPQSSIATLNRLENPQLPVEGSVILIPNLAGIFIPETAESDFEIMLSQRAESLIHERSQASSPEERAESNQNQLHEQGNFRFTLPLSGETWQFIVAEDFTNIERRAFLNVLFRDPLPAGVVSSHYGMRVSPITGRWQFHYGIDIAAPNGTAVQSVLEGRVSQIGEDSVYGRFLRIEHPGGYESLYAHLGRILVDHNERVRSGENIATLGLTGLLTGPHLHLEIFYLGSNRDPRNYIRR